MKGGESIEPQNGPFENEPFVEEIVERDRSGVEVVPFRGYAYFDPNLPTRWRLYLTAELLDYIEFEYIPQNVAEAKRLTQDAPLNSWVVWLYEDAILTYERPRSPRLEEHFFEGEITAGALEYVGQLGYDETSEAAVRFLRISRRPRCTAIWTCNGPVSRPCCVSPK